MTKTKSKAYSLLATLSIVLSATIGMVLALFCCFKAFTWTNHDLPHDAPDVPSVIFCIFAVVVFYALAIGITHVLYHLIGKIFESILDCNIYECSWKSYADGFYVMRRNDQTRDINLSNLRTGGPAGTTQKTYTVYVELSYRQLDIHRVCRAIIPPARHCNLPYVKSVSLGLLRVAAELYYAG